MKLFRFVIYELLDKPEGLPLASLYSLTKVCEKGWTLPMFST